MREWLASGERYDYDRVRMMLTGKSLQPDKAFRWNDRWGYSYGSCWVFEAVPADVLAYLEALPESQVVPAWV